MIKNIKYDEKLVNEKNLISILKDRKEIEFEINNYYYILPHKERFINNNIYDNNLNLIFTIPDFPIIINDKTNLFYYYGIYKYLYISKNKIDYISKYPEIYKNIKDSKTRDNKKSLLRKKIKKFLFRWK